MLTQFVTAKIKLEASPAAMRQAIEVALQTHGDPLRWAVTAMQATEQTVIVEAIVTRKDEV